MTSWPRRGAVAVLAATAVVVATGLLDLDPEPVRVVLLTVLVLAGGWALSGAVARDALLWYAEPAHPPVARGRDRATQTHLRHLESHRTARQPDATVRGTLAGLAERTLRVRYGVGRDSPRGRELLGPEVCAVLEGPVVRLTPRRIDHCLRTIEDL